MRHLDDFLINFASVEWGKFVKVMKILQQPQKRCLDWQIFFSSVFYACNV